MTAWIEYAPEGYSVNALRYILKGRVDLEIEPCMDAIVEKLYENTDTIHVRQQDRVVDIVVKDILYFEGTPKRAIIMHTNSSPSGGVECTGKLTEFEAQLSGKGFLRIHKSFLVNMAHINKIKNYKAVLDTGVELKVSEQKYSDICKQYVLWRGQII